MADGEAALLHAIFQRHHLPPGEVYRMPMNDRAFMYASMELVLEEEEKERKKRARQAG